MTFNPYQSRGSRPGAGPGPGASISADDKSSIMSSKSTTSTKASAKDPMKSLWRETIWTNLSIQAKNLDLPTLPYFDPETMLLSKEVNSMLWVQLGKLYSHLGPAKAALATPIMVEGGEVKWYAFMDGGKGIEADIFDR